MELAEAMRTDMKTKLVKSGKKVLKKGMPDLDGPEPVKRVAKPERRQRLSWVFLLPCFRGLD